MDISSLVKKNRPWIFLCIRASFWDYISLSFLIQVKGGRQIWRNIQQQPSSEIPLGYCSKSDRLLLRSTFIGHKVDLTSGIQGLTQSRSCVDTDSDWGFATVHFQGQEELRSLDAGEKVGRPLSAWQTGRGLSQVRSCLLKNIHTWVVATLLLIKISLKW